MIEITFKRIFENQDKYFVYEAKINKTPIRVKIEKTQYGQSLVSDEKVLKQFLLTKVFGQLSIKL